MSANPVIEGTYSGGKAIYEIDIFTSVGQGNFALVAGDYSTPFRKISLLDKSNPTLFENFSPITNLFENCRGLSAGIGSNWGFVYLSDSGNDSVIIVNQPVYGMNYISSYVHEEASDYLNAPAGIFQQGNYLYVAARLSNAFTILNVSNSFNITLEGYLTGSSEYLYRPWGVFVDGQYAYVVSEGDNDGWNGALVIIDITDKSNPLRIGQTGDEDGWFYGAYRVIVNGNYAYVTNSLYTVIVDVSDKTNPSQVGYIYPGQYPAIYGNYAFVVSNTIAVWDISDKTSTSLIGSVTPPGGTLTGYIVKIKDGHLYVGGSIGGQGRLFVVNPRIYAAPTVSTEQIGSNVVISWDKPISNYTVDIYYVEEEETDADTIRDEGTKIEVNFAATSYIFESANIGSTYSFVVVIKDLNGFESDNPTVSSISVTEAEMELTGIKGESMQQLQKNLTYRLNIASDVNQRAEEAKFWSDTELLRAINEGYLDFVRRTECLQRFETISLVADQIEYDLPSDCIKLLWVGDGVKNLHGQSLDYMDMLDDGWMERSGEPAYFVQELGGLKKIQLYETPETSGISTFTADTNHTEADADTGIIIVLEDASTEITATADSNHSEADEDTGMIVVFTGESVLLPVQSETGAYFKLDQQTANIMILFAYEPQEFNNLTEAKTPAFLAAYHIAIVHFALSELYLKEGETQNIPLSNFYRNLYEEAVENKLATSHVSNLKMTWAGGDRLANLPSDPHLPYDTYPAYRR